MPIGPASLTHIKLEPSSQLVMTKRILAKINHPNAHVYVRHVENLREAARCIMQRRFDIALFVYRVGSPSGLASLSTLRNADADLPVLLISEV